MMLRPAGENDTLRMDARITVRRARLRVRTHRACMPSSVPRCRPPSPPCMGGTWWITRAATCAILSCETRL